MAITTNEKERPCKVLFLAHSSQQGGAEYCLDTLLKNLDRTKVNPFVVFPDEGPMSERCRDYEIPVFTRDLLPWIYLDKRSRWYWKQLLGKSWLNTLRLKKLIAGLGVDLVYSNTSAIFEPALAAKFAGVPHLWHIHEVLDPDIPISQLLPLRWHQRIIRKLSDVVVFESDAAQKVFCESTPIHHSRVVHNSLRFTPKKVDQQAIDQLREQYNLSPRRPAIISVGQFIDRKNPLLLLKAIEKLTPENRPYCIFVGEGPLENEMRRYAAEKKLDDVCRFIPFQSDIAPYLQLSDALVLTSKQESFGLVLIEAGAYGKPVIACKSQGPEEIIDDGKTGYLVPQENAYELANAIRQVILDPAKGHDLGRQAINRIQAMFDAKTNAEKIEAIILECLNGL